MFGCEEKNDDLTHDKNRGFYQLLLSHTALYYFHTTLNYLNPDMANMVEVMPLITGLPVLYDATPAL